jgi:hypothetical protein
VIQSTRQEIYVAWASVRRAIAIDDRGRARQLGGRRPRGESADQQQTGESGMAQLGFAKRRLVRRRGRDTRPADAAAVEMLDEAGRACSGLDPAPALVKAAGEKRNRRISAWVSRGSAPRDRRHPYADHTTRTE